MTYIQNRPATSTDESCIDIKKFIDYLKGDREHSEAISVPSAFSDSIMSKIRVLSPIKSLARITHTSGDRLDVVIESEDVNNCGWVTNDALGDEKKNNISKVSIHLHQLFAKPRVTQSLLDDHSARVEEFLNDKITSQMAASENSSFLFGNGINQPKGILTYDISTEGPKAKHIEAEVGGEPGKITGYEVLVNLMEKLPSKYLAGASWVMSRNAASYIRSMKDPSTNKFLWQNSIAYGVPDTLLGYPVVICDDMPKIATNEKQCVPVLFANLYEGYQIAEKPCINILKDPYNAKPFVEFYATKRVGGDVVNFDAIKALVLKKNG